MKILIDIDDVVANTVKDALSWYNYVNGTSFVFQKVDAWKYSFGPLPLEDIIFEYFRSTSAETLRPIPRSQSITRMLEAQGHELVYVTARPDWMKGRTEAWMRKKGFYGGIIHTNSKHEIDGDLLIDDRPSTVHMWNRIGRNGWLFQQPWNKRNSLPYVRDWSHVLAKIRSMVTA